LFGLFALSDVVEKSDALTRALISIARDAHRELHPHYDAVFSDDAFLDRAAVERAALYLSLEIQARFEIFGMRETGEIAIDELFPRESDDLAPSPIEPRPMAVESLRSDSDCSLLERCVEAVVRVRRHCC